MDSSSLTTMLLQGTLGVAALFIGIAALIRTMTSGYGGLIETLRKDNLERDKKIIRLELLAHEGELFRSKMFEIADTCPITEKPCPLRGLLFKRPSI